MSRRCRVADRSRVVRYFFKVRRCGDKFLFKKTHAVRRPAILVPVRRANSSTVLPILLCLALLFSRVADVLLIYSSRPSPDTRSETSVVSFTSKSTVQSSSGSFAVSCPNRAKYPSKTKVCRGLSQAENVAGVRDFTGRFRAVTFSPAKKRSPSYSKNQFS